MHACRSKVTWSNGLTTGVDLISLVRNAAVARNFFSSFSILPPSPKIIRCEIGRSVSQSGREGVTNQGFHSKLGVGWTDDDCDLVGRIYALLTDATST